VVDPYRLPANVIPSSYDLVLEPDLEAATFSGEVTIQVDVRASTSEVVLNAIDLLIDAAEVAGQVAEVTLDAEHERATLRVEAALPTGPATVRLRFRGVLNDKLHGFYRSTYKDSAGAEHTIATTQFESTDARRAFPCWDEPSLKATFAVTLVVPEGLFAVSNAAVVSEEPTGEGRRRLVFAPTMIMSTYLVAFIVGPLAATDAVDVDGVPLRVIAPPERLAMAPFALEAGAAALRAFTDFFGIPYPGDKLDLVAIPDFAFGAMENLGCVTFRETALLVDEAQGSQADLQRVADVVNHEIAHMWFGDLVTMKWWNGIWLNEAFATFMELKATDAFRPEWDRWTSFGVERAAAFAVDSLAATRPIEFPVISPADAEGMFDVLTYQKGCAVMRMLEQYVGEDGFRDGLRLYMARHAYQNTETGDLWDAIEEATRQPVRSTMDSWILQGGFPLVTATLSADGTAVTLDQERFRLLPDAETDDEPLWSVPVVLRTSEGDVHKVLLSERSTTLQLGAKTDWMVVNAGASGFYRVRYASGLLQALLDDLGSAALTPLERHALVSDAHAGVLSGLAPVTDLLEVVRALAGDDDPDVWTAMASSLSFLGRVGRGGEAEPLVAGLVREVAGPALERVGWEPADGESDRITSLRAVLVGLLGLTGQDPDVRARAKQLFEAWLTDRSSVPPDLVDPVLHTTARTGDPGDYERILQRFRNAATPQEELRALAALSSVEDPALFTRTIELYLSTEVRTQNAPLVLAAAMRSAVGGREAWEAVRRRWVEVNERYPSNTISRLLSGLAAQADQQLAADARGFLAEHPLPQGAKQVAQTLETMDVNARFATEVGPTLADALR
jgi:puromycin-sensitive aminopeptidase